MKIIHTADLHLDSPLIGVSDSVKRRAELINALSELSEVANNCKATAVIVAGDLFDDKFVSSSTVKSVAQIIAQSNLRWFVLRGNHGDIAPYETLHKLCPNVLFFGDNWQRYDIGNVTIVGRELGVNDTVAWQNFAVDADRYNILVLHGDVDGDDYGIIDKKAIANSNVNYVALGHRHAYSAVKFGRVKGCYSGVLEPRGFDELADTGFVIIDTDKDTVVFHKQHLRKVESVAVDVSGVENDVALENLIYQKTADVSARNYLNLSFVGELAEDVRPVSVAKRLLEGKFFALRLKDETKSKVDLAALRKEVSLRGEFVKLAEELGEESRDEVLRLGLHVLNGGDLQ